MPIEDIDERDGQRCDDFANRIARSFGLRLTSFVSRFYLHVLL
jgi:hypothetical protein